VSLKKRKQTKAGNNEVKRKVKGKKEKKKKRKRKRKKIEP
jgi:hypothetical protein